VVRLFVREGGNGKEIMECKANGVIEAVQGIPAEQPCTL